MPCSAEYLRVFSPSAEVQGHSAEQRVTVGGKAAVEILKVEPVGNYAVRLQFDDLHNTGIFTWCYLRKLGQEHAELWAGYLDELRQRAFARALALMRQAGHRLACRRDMEATMNSRVTSKKTLLKRLAVAVALLASTATVASAAQNTPWTKLSAIQSGWVVDRMLVFPAAGGLINPDAVRSSPMDTSSRRPIRHVAPSMTSC